MKLLANKEKNIIISYKKRYSVEYRLVLANNILSEDDDAFLDITKNQEFITILQGTDDEKIQIYLIENMLLFDIEGLECHYVINNVDMDFLKIAKEKKSFNLCVITNNHIDYYFILDKIVGL